MNTEQEKNHKEILKNFAQEVIQQGNSEAAPKYLDPNCTIHSSFTPQPTTGPTALREITTTYQKAFGSSFQINQEAVVAEGNVVGLRATISGKHEGELLGNPPSFKSFSKVPMSIWAQVFQGRISELWVTPDVVALLQQLELTRLQLATAYTER